MTAPTLYRIVDNFPYLDREDEYAGLTLEEAAARMEDLIGVKAEVVISDWDEPCPDCSGPDEPKSVGRRWADEAPHTITKTCATCGGDGKWPGPWQETDEETGREVTMLREVG